MPPCVHHLYYQRGPRKGQIKLCKFCPTPIKPNHWRYSLCERHLAERRRCENERYVFPQRSMASMLRWLGSKPEKKPYRNLDSNGDYFVHLKPEQQVVAWRELREMLAAHPNYSSIQLRNCVGIASARAQHGGRKGLIRKMNQAARYKRYWRQKLSEGHPWLPPGTPCPF